MHAFLCDAYRRVLCKQVLAVVLSAAAPSALGATLTWDSVPGGGIDDGGGTWNLASGNWNNGTVGNLVWNNATGLTDTAVFGNGQAGGTVTLAQNTNVGTITFKGFSGQVGNYAAGSFILNGLSTLNIGSGGASTSTISAGITNTGNLSISNGTSGSALTLSGAVNLGGSTLFTGTNANITLNGTAANTLALRVQQGSTVILNKTAGVNAVSGNVTVGGTGNYTGASVLQLGASDQIADTAILSGGHNHYGGSGYFRLAGFNETIGGISGGSGGVGNWVIQNNAAAASILTVNLAAATSQTTGAGLVVQDGSTGALTLVFGGTGTQVFNSAALQHTGGTSINSGTVRLLNSSSAAASAISIGNGATLDLQGSTINGTLTDVAGAALTVTGGTTSTFGGAANSKTYSATTAISGNSTLRQGAANTFSANSVVAIAGGSTLSTNAFSGTVMALADLAGGTGSAAVTLTGTSANVLTLANGGGNTFSGNISGAGSLALTAGVQTLAGADTHTGTTTVNGGTLRAGSTTAFSANSAMTVAAGATLDLNGFGNSVASLAGAGSLTNSSATAATLTTGGDNTSTTFSGAISGATSLVKAGTGNFTLSGVSTFSGTTTVNSGTLTLNTTAGNILGANTTGLTMAGGTLALTGTGGMQTVGGSTTFVAGTQSKIIRAGGTAGNDGVGGYALDLGNVTAPTGLSLNIDAGNYVHVSNFAANTLLGGWVTVGATNALAATDANGYIVAYTGFLDTTHGTALAGTAGAYRLNNTGAGPNTIAAGATTDINSITLNQNDFASQIAISGGQTLRLGASGALSAAAQTTAAGTTAGVANTVAWTIGTDQAGTLTAGGAADTAGQINLITNSAQTMTIAAAIADNGAGQVSVAKTGTGTVAITSTNGSYTGSTSVLGGTVGASKLSNGGAASSIGQSSGAASNLSLDGGTLQYTGSGDSTDRLFQVGVNGATLDASGTGAVNFTNAGSIGFTGAGAHGLTLTGTNTGSNTLAGLYANNGGASSLTKGGTGRWVVTGNNTYGGTTTINDGGGTTSALVFGDGTATGNKGLGSGGVTIATTGAGRSATIGFNYGNAQTVSNAITQTGSGTGNLVKDGTGALTLSGANNYAGTTTIMNGTVVLGSGTGTGSNAGNAATRIIVQSGATFDFNATGAGTFYKSFTIAGTGYNNAGAITNSVAQGWNSGQAEINNVTLTADATVGGLGDIWQIAAGHAVQSLDLTNGGANAAGYALTKQGTGRYAIDNTNVGNGSIAVNNGTFYVWNRNQNTSVGGTGTLTVKGTGTAQGDVQQTGANNAVLALNNIQANGLTKAISLDGGTILTLGSTVDSAIALGSTAGQGAVANNVRLWSNQSSTFRGAMTGTGGFTLTSENATPTSNTLTLAGTAGQNTYSGNTTIASGTLKAATGVSNIFNAGSRHDLAGGANAAMDLNGTSQVVGSLAGAGGSTVTSSAAGAVTLTVGNDNTSGAAFAGAIQNGSGTVSLTKVGTGVQNLSGNSTYTGATTISGGTLRLGGTLDTTGATVWLDASQLATGATNTWTNLISGGAGNFTNGGANGGGTVQGGGTTFNNLNVMHFAGNQVLKNTAVNSTDATVVYIGAMDGTQNARLVGGTNNNWLLGYWGGVRDRAYFNGWLNQGNTAITTAAQVYAASITGGSTASFYNNGTLLTTGTGGTQAPNGLTLGGYSTGNGSEDSKGSIGEILVFNSALSQNQLINLQGYLQAKWGQLTNVLPTVTAVNITTSGATLDINGAIQTIGSLTGVAGSAVTLGTGKLTIGDATSTTFAGNISGGGANPTVGQGQLTKQGSGTLTLSGSVTNTGGTTLGAGTLQLDYGTNAATKLSGTDATHLNSLVFSGGTLELSNMGATSETVSSATMSTGTASYILRDGTNATGKLNLTNIVNGGGAFLDISDNTAANSNGGEHVATTKQYAGANVGANQLLGGLTINGIYFAQTAGTQNADGSYDIVAKLTGYTDVGWGGTVGNDNTQSAIINLTEFDSAGTARDGVVNGTHVANANVVLGAVGTGNAVNIGNLLQSKTGTYNAGTNAGGDTDLADNGNTVVSFGGKAVRLSSSGSVRNPSGKDGLTLGASAGDGVLTAGNTAGTTGGTVTFVQANTANATTVNAYIADNGTAWTSGLSGTAGATVGLVKSGAGTLVLNAANTYTGTTLVADNTGTNQGTVAVAVLANGGTASGLGRSSNAASNLTLDGGTLKYVGTAATSTDRLFTMSQRGAGLNSSGSGAVTFSNTGAVAMSGSGARTLTLNGTYGDGTSAAQTNTFASQLTDGTGGATSLAINGNAWALASTTSSFTGGTTVRSGGLVSLNATTFNNANTAGALGNNNSLTLDNGTLQYTGATLSNNRAVTLGAGGGTVQVASAAAQLTLSGVVSGTGAPLTKTGQGMLILTNTNTYTGTTTLGNGILRSNSGGNSGSLGTGNLTFNGVVNNTAGNDYNPLGQAMLGLAGGDFTRALGTGSNQVRFTGNGGFVAYGADRYVNFGGTGTQGKGSGQVSGSSVTWNGTGNFLGANNTLFLGDATQTHTVYFENNINLGGTASTDTRTVNVARGGAYFDAALDSNISGTGGLTKTGTGILMLGNPVSQNGTANNTYTGDTVVQAGTLICNNNLGNSATGGGSVTVQSGASLGGYGQIGKTGSVAPTVNINAGAFLMGGQDGRAAGVQTAGTGIEGLTVYADTMNLAGTYLFDVNYANVMAGSAASETVSPQTAGDTVHFRGNGAGGGTLNFAGSTFQIGNEAGTRLAGGSHFAVKIFEWDAGVSVNGTPTFSLSSAQLAAGYSVVQWGGAYYLVPEPASALLLCPAMLLLMRRPSRRRRQG